jgi:AAA family ATP:ADP antiporter
MSAVIRKLLSPIVELRDKEFTTALLMFAYSLLAMASYTALKPVTRSQFIKDLGADNLPLVQFAFGALVGFVMQAYIMGYTRLPRRWALPLTLGGLAVVLVAFWLWFQTASPWASTAFYFFGLLMGILLISQFWTLANVVYDPRQAKRIFGFIGAGATLGGIIGSAISIQAERIGTVNLLLVSAVLILICAVLVAGIVVRENTDTQSLTVEEERGVGATEAVRLLAGSSYLQTVALIIAFAAIGAAIVDQQLNMATAEAQGQGNTDGITSFLGQVQLYTSMIGAVVQIWLTSRIQRHLGIGVALLVLPLTLGMTGSLILLSGAIWTTALARVVDTSLRYTLDKTTREILFMPLPSDMKQRAKPFIDVTVDRFSKGFGALLVLVLIKDRLFGVDIGLGLSWRQLSWASLAMIGLWVMATVRARREYQAVFRRTLDRQDVAPESLMPGEADLSTIEILVEAQGHPDPRHVTYAIDMLESLDKRHLVSPLLLNHEAPSVRARALLVLEGATDAVRQRWSAGVERLLKDDAPEVRAAAVRALASVRGEAAIGLMRPLLDDRDPRLAVTAAAALATSPSNADVDAAEATLVRLSGDPRPSAASARRDVARALGAIDQPRFHRLLVPLMYDAQRDVALEAIRSAGRLGGDDFLFVPPLVSLLRNRLLKASARLVLVGYGEGVIDVLAAFLRDPDEDIWIRRHVASTLALIPSQRTVDVLAAALSESDGFLRFKVISALLHLKQTHPQLAVSTAGVQPLLVQESNRYFSYLSLHYNLVNGEPPTSRPLVARALEEKIERTVDRLYRLLGLLYPWKDISAARWSLQHGDRRIKASAAEYLDNLLDGAVRARVMPVLEDLPMEEKVRRGNALLKTRVRDAEDSLAQLVHDEDQIVAAAAMLLVDRRGLWQAFAGDLAHALEHRDPSDWYVFEAASWVLAGGRLTTEQRQSRWLEPLPAVEIADRLARLPLFADTTVDELFRIAHAGRQVRYEPGRRIYEAGQRATDLQFLLDGRVTLVAPNVGAESATPDEVAGPAAFGFHEVFEGVPHRSTAAAHGIAIVLTMLHEQFLSLLSENTELAQGVFRTLLTTPDEWASAAVTRDVVRPSIVARPGEGLQMIEKMLVLAGMPVLSRASSDQLQALAGIARQTTLNSGDVVVAAGDAPAIHIILDGELSVEPLDGGAAVRAGAGDCTGLFETLGGRAETGWRGQVTRPGVALRIDREGLFDLLADQIDLLQGLFSALQGAPVSRGGTSTSRRPGQNEG